MKGYLVAEEGPLAGTTIVFEEGVEDNEWFLGRDPETSDVILEDPMVSRKHAVVRFTPEGFILENLSTVNPSTQNGMVVAEPVLLKEGDIIQIGSTFFNFTEKTPEPEEPIAPSSESKEEETLPPSEETPAEMPSELHFGPHPETRWLLKVISGPNAGAEFAMHRSSTYLIGKDPNICDVVFQDLSVSRQHARLSIDDEDNVFVEDLGSRNGVIVNGELISEKTLLSSQDLIALGTTTFLVIDRHEARETIISPPVAMPTVPPTKAQIAAAKAKEKRDWKELIIPKKHLVIAGIFGAILFTSVFGMFSLFKSQPVMVKQIDESGKIRDAIAMFEDVQFSFNRPTGKIFLIGHVLTTVRHQELLYALKELPFIQDVNDNVIIDELVWQNMNALFSTNPEWIGVSMYSPKPGKFVLRGYIETLEETVALNDYVNLNFNYLDRLENQVIVEKNLQIEIASLLLANNLSAISFELINGDLVLAGQIDKNQNKIFDGLVNNLKKVPGIREVKNYVVVTSEDASRTNLSNDFKVTGYSKRDEKDFYVVINGKILGQGDLLEGMIITKINPKMVFLEKEGQRFRIDYNIQ